VKHVALAACAAGLVLAHMPEAVAGDRPGRQYSPYTPRPNYTAQSAAHAGNVERRCVTESCGTTWCYNVKR